MRTLFLLDIDCFFAAVEMAQRPELRGKPVCVGGTRGDRGIVVCPNYEARAYGVRTPMPIRTASRLLPPGAVFLRGNHRLYREYAERVMGILYDFTPDLRQVSVDEAYMDVSGCLHFWGGDPRRMAAAIKERILRECGLTVSVGAASNALCAKIAAGLKKPDGLVIVPAGKEGEFLAPLPLDLVPGVGAKTLPLLHARKLFTVADVLERGGGRLRRMLAAAAAGDGRGIQGRESIEHSISRDTTFGRDTNDRETILAMLYCLIERACKTLRTQGKVAATVTVKIRFAHFMTVQKQTTLRTATASENVVFAAAQRLVDILLPPCRFVRLVGVKVSNLSAAGGGQMALDAASSERIDGLHRTLDALQAAHGRNSIRWGITLGVKA